MSNDSDIVIRVEHLHTAFGPRVVHEDVSFDVRRSEVFGILGGSGSGKSVLLRQMIGLYHPQRGRVLIGEEDMATAEGATRVALLKKIGVMFQLGALFGSMTLLENVRLPLEAHTNLSEDEMNLIARMKLDLVGLKGFENYLSAQISGGMVKRAAIARAMALDPGILMLDEPSAGLDPVTSAGLDRLIVRLRDALGITVVVVTHELASIFAIADRVIMLDKHTKGIVAEGAPADLRDHSDNVWVQRFFNREPEDVEANNA